MFEGLLLVANIVQFGALMALLLGTPRPRHADGWLHGGRGVWRLERPSGTPPYTWHLNGVPYDKAPLPPRRHRCQAQTCSLSLSLHHEDRCACGAARVGVYGAWLGRNLRWDSLSRV